MNEKQTFTADRLLFATQQGNYAVPKIRYSKRGKGYWVWGYDGPFDDNQYPQYLLNLYDNSPLHTSAINFKHKMITANGLYSLSENEKIVKFINRCNRKGDKLTDVFRKCVLDFELFGSFAIQLNYGLIGGKILEAYYIDVSKFRWNLERDKLRYCQDWTPKWSAQKTIECDVYNSEDPTGLKIFYYTSDTTRDVYSTPSYVSGITSIETNIEHNNYHLNEARQGMFPSLAMDFKNGKPTEEERNNIERDIKAKWGGTSNAGKIMISFSDADNPSPTITKIDQPDLDKRYLSTRDIVRDEILFAHHITSPSLLGVQTPGKLGGLTEYNQAFQIFDKNYIKPQQKQLTDVFNGIFSNNFKKCDIDILPNQQIDTYFTEEQLIAANMTKEEFRKVIKRQGFINDIQLPPGADVTETIDSINGQKAAATN